MFMYKTVIYVVHVYECLFWACSQSENNNLMECFKEDGPSYKWNNSKEESVYEFLGIDTKTLDDGGCQFYQTLLIRKVLEATGLEHCNELPTPTKVEAPLGTDDHVS